MYVHRYRKQNREQDTRNKYTEHSTEHGTHTEWNIPKFPMQYVDVQHLRFVQNEISEITFQRDIP